MFEVKIYWSSNIENALQLAKSIKAISIFFDFEQKLKFEMD